MNKTQLQKTIRAYIKKIKNEGIPVGQVFIFGSQVKGSAHLGSDIDTCIVSPAFGKDRQRERILLMNLREGVSDLIEPHPYSEIDFQNSFDPLIRQIKETGIRVV